MKKELIVECKEYDENGYGIVRDENKKISVPFLLKNEKATIQYIEFDHKIIRASIIEIEEKSKQRVQPICPLYGYCGGCNLQHMTYEEQLSFKKDLVHNYFKQLTGLICPVQNTMGMETPYKYRNKVQCSFSRDQYNKIVGGFYCENSHQIIDRKECYLENEYTDKIIDYFKLILNKYDIELFDRTGKGGSIKGIVVRTNRNNSEMMITIVTNTKFLPCQKEITKDLVTAFPKIKTIVHNINPGFTTKILGDEEHIVFGTGFIVDKICDINFQVSSKSFFQTNPLQTEKLYTTAINLANLSSTDVILDAYCGVGTIGLIASKKCHYVYGVEIIKEAIFNAKTNADINHIHNVDFTCLDASIYIKQAYFNNIVFDCVFVDPPRNGLDNKFIYTLLQFHPKKIIYISCNPKTLAKDINLLKRDYDVKLIQPVDMFPQTVHVEIICQLLLKK